MLLAHRAAQHVHHHRGDEADADLGIAELRVVAGEHDVACGRKAATTSDRTSLHRRDDRLLHAAHGEEYTAQVRGVPAMRLLRGIEHFGERVEVYPGAEIFAVRLQED